MTRLQAVRLAGASAAGLSALLFAALAWAVVTGASGSYDTAIRDWVHGTAGDPLTALAFALTFIGSTGVWVAITLIAIAVFLRLARRKAAEDLAIVMIGAVLLENALKLTFERARPQAFFGALPESYSFPSGHAIYAGTLYGALACLIADRISSKAAGVALWVAAVLLAGTIGMSRIYLGVHYPSDVAAGFLVAIFWVGLVTAFRAGTRR
jgi:undecaprenyl-diphosphatase